MGEAKTRELEKLENEAREIGKVLQEHFSDRVGFALFLFERAKGGWLTYISNGSRIDMVEVLHEFLERPENKGLFES